MSRQNKYEKELDDLIVQANEGNELTPDAMTTVLTEFSVRMQSRILVQLEQINKKLNKLLKDESLDH